MSRSKALSASYIEHVAALERRLDSDRALQQAVGGEFVAVGKLEYHLLRSRGLKDADMIVDVGCGSGRLACQVAPFPGIRYVGCDVVPRLLEYARDLCGRPDWRFELTAGARIPCEPDVADFACFFSVFTHLAQEDIFRYFREAQRVLRPGGLMIFSFLEFRIAEHWAVFIASVDRTREDAHLNQFIDRASIHAWADATGFEIRSIHGGDTKCIPLPEEIRYENGSRISGVGSLGQSVAVLQKRELPAGGPMPSNAPAAAALISAPAAPSSGAAAPGVLRNASTRVFLRAGESASLGFSLAPGAPQRVLVRAVGPTLSAFGVLEPLARPALAIHAGEERLAENTGWSGHAEVATAAATAGAFTLAATSLDAALVLTLPPGSYTAVATSAEPAESGEVAIEVSLIG